jgi:hypothetical protein
MKEEREGKKRRGGRSRVGVVMIIKTNLWKATAWKAK